jgi:hypothetical protein
MRDVKIHECCGNCRYAKHEEIDKGIVCCNPDSDSLADWVSETDFCYEYEGEEDE